MLYRRLTQACERRPGYVLHAGRMLAWTGWAALLFGVARKSAAQSALDQFPAMFSGWWIPQDGSGFLLAGAAVIGGLTLWASGKKL
ncbi:MAG TPA: hypothetical protein VN361_09925, partial [Oxalicibacterium sp.]|nr:hypothetical protein [Oxalicibacterium sp.]